MQLSTVGALFIERARLLLAQAADLHRDAVELHGGTLGSVPFTANPCAARALVAQVVQAVWRCGGVAVWPGLRIVADQHNPERVLDRLQRREIEFCIGRQLAVSGPGRRGRRSADQRSNGFPLPRQPLAE